MVTVNAETLRNFFCYRGLIEHGLSLAQILSFQIRCLVSLPKGVEISQSKSWGREAATCLNTSEFSFISSKAATLLLGEPSHAHRRKNHGEVRKNWVLKFLKWKETMFEVTVVDAFAPANKPSAGLVSLPHTHNSLEGLGVGMVKGILLVGNKKTPQWRNFLSFFCVP